jgi:hypothetical protein
MCFISGCGVKSVMEAILAGVPIIVRITDISLLFSHRLDPLPHALATKRRSQSQGWPRQWDQVPIASQLHAVGLGVGLIQHRRGCIVGRKVAHRRHSEQDAGREGFLGVVPGREALL